MEGPLQKYPRNGTVRVWKVPCKNIPGMVYVLYVYGRSPAKYPRNGVCTCLKGPLQKYPRNGVWKVLCKNIPGMVHVRVWKVLCKNIPGMVYGGSPAKISHFMLLSINNITA
jgi:hypothetical protein